MNVMLTNKILLGCAALSIMMITACEKTVEIDPPLNEVTTEIVFSTDKLAGSALAGMYTGLAQLTTQTTSLPVNGSLFADDLLYIGANPTYMESAGNAYTVVSTTQGTIFSDLYAIIYRANSIIEGLQKYPGTSAQAKKQLTAEAKVIRAYCYFNLVNIFGDVPLVVTTDVTVTAMLPRETVTNVYAQIVKDLTDAKADLPSDYSSSASTRLGVNRFTATALLARTYMFTGNYALAESNASEVIASSLYSLIPPATMATGVWTKNNAESIWQMSSPIAPTNQYVVESQTFLPSAVSGVPQFEIRPAFLQLFESTDLRKRNWTRDYTVSGAIKTLPYKYKYNTNALAVAAGVAESPTVLRLAEQYLIRAEARVRLGGNIQGAMSDLNAIRARAQARLSTTTAPATLLQEIIDEYRKEFFCEQAHRWYNIKRLGTADQILSTLKTGYRPISKLLPIPTTAIDRNPNLTQNPGY